MVRGGRRGCGRSQHPDGLRDWVAESRRRTAGQGAGHQRSSVPRVPVRLSWGTLWVRTWPSGRWCRRPAVPL